MPNFSEGRDRAVIDAIADAIRKTAGCALLDVDPGASTNRTVYTLVGPPEAVVEGALAGARVARQRIDMRTQKGEHPRVGALDVCPFVPVSGGTMDECVALANELGRRAAEELGVPVFLYGHAARADHRRTLQQIRTGEYEGLAERLAKPEWKPDYGPAAFVPSSWRRCTRSTPSVRLGRAPWAQRPGRSRWCRGPRPICGSTRTCLGCRERCGRRGPNGREPVRLAGVAAIVLPPSRPRENESSA